MDNGVRGGVGVGAEEVFVYGVGAAFGACSVLIGGRGGAHLFVVSVEEGLGGEAAEGGVGVDGP
eukprot:5559294-Prorocentrum_lima.AAC.1